MSGDIYNCDKCGESIHTSCDCGFPDNTAMEKENLELRALVKEGFAQWEINLIDEGLHPSNTVYKHLFKKAEKYKQGREG